LLVSRSGEVGHARATAPLGVVRIAKRLAPAPVWSRLRRLKVASAGVFQKSLERAGYTVAQRDDYYSPLTSVTTLRATFDRWNRPSALKGVAFDVDAMKRDLSSLFDTYRSELAALPSYEDVKREGFGVGYNAFDAVLLYLMIRKTKPKRYIEVGAGMSTFYCGLAARENAREGHPLEITCIEPFPFERLHSLPGLRVIPRQVQDVDLAVFAELAPNDVLFIDSTHVVKIDGDVPFLFLEVLPRLSAGVVVHVHDISFPYNIPYPPEHWVLDRPWPMLWTEAMLLQAFLCMNDAFRITMSLPLIRHFDEAFLRQTLPAYRGTAKDGDAFSSLWMTRVA